MAETKTPNDHGFSRDLERAISPRVRQVEADLPVVRGDDLATLKKILRGEAKPPFEVDPKRAINALTRSERSEDVAQILSAVLSREQETTKVRTVAAHNLAMLPPEFAEKPLLRNIATADGILRDEIVTSLGRVGTAESLKRLEELPAPPGEARQRLLVLAKAAIGVRSGMKPPDLGRVLGVRWSDHRLNPLEPGRVREELTRLWDSTFGIALNPEFGFELDCGNSKNLLFLNAEIKSGNFLASAATKPLIAGLVALREDDTPHSTVRYVVFTTPAESGIEIVVTRKNGQVAFAGQARIENEALRISLRDVGQERTPTAVEGTVTNDRIDLKLRVWRGAAKSKRPGLPVQVRSAGAAGTLRRGFSRSS